MLEDEEILRAERTKAILDDIAKMLGEVEENAKSLDQASDIIEAITAGSMPKHVPDDALLKLQEVVCLPQFGGHLAVKSEYSRESETFSEKVIRGYIKKGLPVVRKGKTILIRPAAIKEFFQEGQDQPSPLTSSGSARVTTGLPGNSSGNATGRSKMDRSSLARDSALNLLETLKRKG